jgi:predicted nucleotidyltransferase
VERPRVTGPGHEGILDRVDLLPGERLALSDFQAWVRARFGPRLRELALFGSRARGDGSEESDLDVLVAVDDLSGVEGREIGHTAGDVLTRHNVWISPFALSSARLSELRARERLIAREIDRDAVPL